MSQAYTVQEPNQAQNRQVLAIQAPPPKQPQLPRINVLNNNGNLQRLNAQVMGQVQPQPQRQVQVQPQRQVNGQANPSKTAIVPYAPPQRQGQVQPQRQGQVQPQRQVNGQANPSKMMLVPYAPPPQQQANNNANKMVVLYKGRNAANTSIPNSNDAKGTLASSLGVELADGKMHKVASRNTPLPAKITQTFSTADDNQTFAIIEVFEGEASNAKDNKALGAFQLDGIPAMPKRQPRILITFDIDERGRVSVTATEKTTGATSGMGIRANRSRLQQVQPQQTRVQQVQPQQARVQQVQGQQARVQQVQGQGQVQQVQAQGRGQVQQAARGRAQRNAARQAFDQYLSNVARAINTNVSQDKRAAVEEAVLDESSWLENNPNAAAEEYNARLSQLKALVNASVKA